MASIYVIAGIAHLKYAIHALIFFKGLVTNQVAKLLAFVVSFSFDSCWAAEGEL